MNSSSQSLPLLNLNDNGTPPKSRIEDASSAYQIANTLNDQYNHGPGIINAKVKACIDGNPPLPATKLRELGQDWRFNLNFRLLEGDVSYSSIPFYSIFSEVPYYLTVVVEFGNPTQRDEWQSIISEEHYRQMQKWKGFDHQMQLSIDNRVKFGCGPLYFPDKHDPKFRAARVNEVFLPQDTSLDSEEWEVACIIKEYTVTELFSKINCKSAAKAGWNVEACRQAIITVCNSYDNVSYNWEYWQTRIRHNDVFYSVKLPKIRSAQVLIKEFSGNVSQFIVRMSEQGTEFLYSFRERFSSFNQVLHLMPGEIGDGYVGGVKGLGVKAFNYRDTQNRLKNISLDAALIGSQVLVQSETPEAEEGLDIIPFGPFMKLPYNVKFSQTPLGSIMDKPLAMDRDLEQGLMRNIGGYRQNLQDAAGSPNSATEAEINHGVAQTISTQQNNLFVSQLDDVYEEQMRRLCQPLRKESVDYPYEKWEKFVHTFQKRCVARGVPKEALRHIVEVKAFRSIGQGSKFFKNQLFEKALGLGPLLPPDVRDRVVRNYVVSLFGKEYADSVWPRPEFLSTTTDQESKAQDENGAIRSKVMPVWTPNQDNGAHLKMHLGMGFEMLGLITQGQMDPTEYLDIAGNLLAHIETHIQRLLIDSQAPTPMGQYNEMRNSEVKEAVSQYQELKGATDQLAQQVQASQEAQAQAMQEQAAAQAQAAAAQPDPDTAIKMQKAQADIAIKQAKAQNDIQLKSVKTQQQLAANDAKTAQKIRNGSRKK